MLYVGNGKVESLYIGGSKVKELYSGSSLLYTSGTDTVRIGENRYPYVKIGNQLWLSTNFKENLTGSLWFNNDQETYEPLEYGKLYPWATICNDDNTMTDELTAILPTGWHVPTLDDWITLCDFAGIEDSKIAYSHKCLKAVEWNGTDLYGFHALPCGRYINKTFSNDGLSTGMCLMWLGTKKDATTSYSIVLRPGSEFARSYALASVQGLSLRLVKNL